MYRHDAQALRPHYLVEIDPKPFLEGNCEPPPVPEWVGEHLRANPFAVVRRGPVTGEHVPIGVRGAERNQRWAARCQPKLVRRVITPPQLLARLVPRSRADAAPALRALQRLESRWMDLDHPWGPGGSVGFELATGRQVVKGNSDLDIVIYATRRMLSDEARALSADAMELPATVDNRVETPVCGFSLREYACASAAAILLRTQSGAVLGRDPWRANPGS